MLRHNEMRFIINKIIYCSFLLFISFSSNASYQLDTTHQQYRYSRDHSAADSILNRMIDGYSKSLSRTRQPGLQDPSTLNPSRSYYTAPFDSTQSINPRLSAMITFACIVFFVIIVFYVRRAIKKDNKAKL